MNKVKLYLDSSVLGWALNRGNPSRFAEANLLLNQIAEGKFIGLYSWVTEQEIEAAPEHIAEKLNQKVQKAKLKKVSNRLKSEANKLAQIYCDKGIVPLKFKEDALHIAIATLSNVDALVSYNFQHIVNLQIMIAINEVNKSLNLNEIFLCQPQEVIANDNQG